MKTTKCTLMRQVKLLRRELEGLAKTRKDESSALKQKKKKNIENGGEKEREKEGKERDPDLRALAFRFAHADELDF